MKRDAGEKRKGKVVCVKGRILERGEGRDAETKRGEKEEIEGMIKDNREKTEEEEEEDGRQKRSEAFVMKQTRQ